jgi:zinc transporter ZupT
VASCLFHQCHPKGHIFYHQGELADRLYIVGGGEAAIVDAGERGRRPQYLQPFEAFGFLSLLTAMPRSKTVVATQETCAWVLLRSDLDELLHRAPTFQERVRSLLADRTLEHYLTVRHRFSEANAMKWVQRARKCMSEGRPLPSAGELSAPLPDQHGAPLAIWLGILLDGVPEALVIGASMVHGQLGASLLGGLFIANYPEALSSSAGMRERGFSVARIHLMWGSLVVLTGALAALGNVFFTDASPLLFTFIQGIAAGAMLTMIAQTMLPEAYLRGGSVVGVATLLGFLAAIVLKSFE